MRCAFPDCDQVVAARPGGSQPKYCGKEHAVEARRLRQRARAEAEHTEPVSPAETAPIGPAPAAPATTIAAAAATGAGTLPPGSEEPGIPRRTRLRRVGGAVAVLAALSGVGPASVAAKDTPPAVPQALFAPPVLPTAGGAVATSVPDAQVVQQVGAVPAPPTGLTATPGNGAIDLCWQPVVGATAYVAYYRDATKGEDWQRMPYPITDTCWHAGQLWNGHNYQFRLTSSDTGGESAYSGAVGATPFQPKPGVPGGLTISSGNGQARLCWKAAPNADMYVMYHRDVTTGEPWTRAQYPITSGLCWTPQLLTNGHRYQFRITAANSDGESDPSAVVEATPSAPLPAAPTGVTATPGSGKVLLCWRPAAGANAYVADYRDLTIGQDWVTMPYPIQNSTCWNADQLWNTHTYQFRVKASNNNGSSDYSGTVQATPA